MRDIVVESERDIVLDFGPVTRKNQAGVDVAIDLSAAGTKLWFTVKESIDDTYAEAIVAKTYTAGGASDGFTIATPSSTTVPNGTIEIADDEIEITSDIAIYVWDLTLEEPATGRRETVERGAFKIRLPVTNP